LNNSITVRSLYKTIPKTKTHLVQSREIATTCVCPYLFKMSYPFGVSEGERDYLAANTVHDIMSIALPTTILENWQMGAKKFEWISIAEKIEKGSQDIVEKAISNAQEKIKTEEKALPSKNFNLEGFRADVEYRFHGLLVGIAKRLMTHYEQPKRALTEVTISIKDNTEFLIGKLTIRTKQALEEKIDGNLFQIFFLQITVILVMKIIGTGLGLGQLFIIKKLTFQIYLYSKIGSIKSKTTGNLLMRFYVEGGPIHKNRGSVLYVTEEENLLLNANFTAKIQDSHMKGSCLQNTQRLEDS
jgi:small basic protein